MKLLYSDDLVLIVKTKELLLEKRRIGKRGWKRKV